MSDTNTDQDADARAAEAEDRAREAEERAQKAEQRAAKAEGRDEDQEDQDLKEGKVVAVAGPVIDVEFPPDGMPDINNALQFEIEQEDETTTVVAEVAQQIGDFRVRAICMKPTDGLRRGATVRNTGRGISVPVGSQLLGHVFNTVGETLDTEKIDEPDDRWEIHRPPPPFDELEPKTEMFETGIKVIDLLAPYSKGGKVGLFGGAGVGKTVVILEMIRRVPCK